MSRIDSSTQTNRILFGFSMASVIVMAFFESIRFNNAISYGTPGEAIVTGLVPTIIAIASIIAILGAIKLAKAKSNSSSISILTTILLVAYSLGVYLNSISTSYATVRVGSSQSGLGDTDILMFATLFALQTALCVYGITKYYKESNFRDTRFILITLLLLASPSIVFSFL